jgi:hypothetical protein
MKTLWVRPLRLVLFVATDPNNWATWSYTADGYNIIASLSILGLEIGFEYARKTPQADMPRCRLGWAWIKLR